MKIPVPLRLRPVRRMLALSLLVGLSTGCASLGTEAPEDFDLTGEWALDASASDAVPQRPVASAGGRASRGRGGPRGGRGGAGGPPGEMAIDQGLLHAERVTIEQDELGFTLAFASHPDQDIRIGEQILRRGESEAGWTKEGVLEVHVEFGDFERTQRFTLSEDGERLTVETLLDPPRGRELELVRIFDRVTAEPPADGIANERDPTEASSEG